LQEVTVSNNKIVPEFTSTETDYVVTVPFELDKLEISVKPRNKNSLCVGPTGPIDLKIFETLFIYSVTSEDKSSNQTYTISVKKRNRFLIKLNHYTEFLKKSHLLNLDAIAVCRLYSNRDPNFRVNISTVFHALDYSIVEEL
jgi:hypothetical protein